MGDRRLAVHEHYPPSRGCIGGCGNYREGRECCCPGERGEPTANDLAAFLAIRPALLADLLALLPVEHARPAVRAYLARDPEAAAKVAGPWVRVDERNTRRWLPGERFLVAAVWRGEDGSWYASVGSVGRPTRAEAEAAVDALLVGDGWVLGRQPDGEGEP